MAIEANQTATLGHEGAGYVEKIHPSVEDKGFKVGDRIGFLYIIGCCFECEGCQIHNLHCVTGKQTLQGFTSDGFFAEYAVVDAFNCIHLPESMDEKTAAPIFCAGITAFHAVDNAELKEGDWLAVVGAGGLGQIATQIGKAMGCKVVALDINDATLEVCKQQGADAVFNSRTNKDYVEELKKLTNGGAKAACVFSNADPVSSTLDIATMAVANHKLGIRWRTSYPTTRRRNDGHRSTTQPFEDFKHGSRPGQIQGQV